MPDFSAPYADIARAFGNLPQGGGPNFQGPPVGPSPHPGPGFQGPPVQQGQGGPAGGGQLGQMYWGSDRVYGQPHGGGPAFQGPPVFHEDHFAPRGIWGDMGVDPTKQLLALLAMYFGKK